MFRIVIICGVLLLASLDGARAQSPAERGSYLVNTIMACGNCHTPRDASGKAIAEKALSGNGLTFTTPVFIATAPNITPDVETGIGSWSDAEIKRALVEGIRPDHGHLAGVPLAAIMPANFYKALLPDDLDAIVAYLRTVKPLRSEVPDPVYKAPVHRDPYPDAEAGFSKAMFTDPVRRGAYLRHHRPLHGVPRRKDARRVGLQKWTGPRRQGFPAACGIAGWNARQHRRQHHHRSDRRHRRLERFRNRPRHYRWHCPRRTSAQAADGLCLLCRTEAGRSGRHHRLFAHGAAAAMKPSQNSRFHRGPGGCILLEATRDTSANVTGMIDTVTKPRTKVQTKTERPRLHKVILVNDDFTPREFVVTVLKAEFRMTEDQAHKVMITAHRRGVCVVAVFTKDVAETKATRATDAGRAKGYPLLFTTEPEE